VVFGAGPDVELDVRYRFAEGSVSCEVNGEPVDGLVLWSAAPDRVVLEVSGVRREVAVHRVGDVCYLDSPLGSSVLTERPRFPAPFAAVAPGSLLAPMPGRVVRIGAEPGTRVRAGTPVVVLEAMKMEHTVSAPHDGVLAELPVVLGQQVDTGAVLAVVVSEDR
jgi:biotin carboxyl carrier protein